MIQDCLSALRTFRRNPILTAIAIICLSLGIGGTTAVFSVINGVLLEHLPYPDSDRLVVLRTEYPQKQEGVGRLSEADVRDWQMQAASFEAIAGYRWMPIDIVDSESSDRLQGLWVTPEYFSIFGVKASSGRILGPEDPFAIVLGRAVWQRRFAANPSIVGQSIPIGICCPQQPQNLRINVAGVIDHDIPSPPTLPGLRDSGHGLNDTIDYWGPLNVKAARRGSRNLEAVAKLKPGVTIAQAQSEMDAIASRQAENYPDTNKGWTVRVLSLNDALFAGVRPVLLVLMAAAAFVLLIACANVGVLLTFDAIRRSHEAAVRAALGASAGRLLRQYITESVLLTMCGGAAGLLVAEAARRVLLALAPAGLPRISAISIDGRAFLVAGAAALASGIVIGLASWLRVLKTDLESTLRSENSRNATSHARARTYEPLLAAQVALTLALLIGSGLMFKSVNRLLGLAPGFNPSNAVTTTLSLPSAKHAWSYNSRFIERVLDRVREIKGVDAAGAIRGVPMKEVVFSGTFRRWDKPVADPAQGTVAVIRVVSEEYFRVMGIPIVGGRDFVRQDGVGEVGKTRVVIVNQTMARLLWPGENPVGRKVNDYGAEVIGVIGDVRYAGLDRAPVPEVYYPEGVFPQDEFSLVVRTAANNAAMIESIRKAIHEVEADVFIGKFQSMNELIASSEGQRRFVTILLSVFSGTGLLLAVAGIAGIVAYSLSLRVREIGIRVAMGATSRDVVALISRQGVVPAFAGLVFGCILAVSLTRFLSALLFEVDPYDPAVFASAIIALAFVCIVTAGLAAYRACRVDASSILK